MSQPGTPQWRSTEAARLIAFGRAAALADGGFGWLGVGDGVDTTLPRPVYINSRMTYVFTLAHLTGAAGLDGLDGWVWSGGSDGAAGCDGAGALARSGLRALVSRYADGESGGWFSSLDSRGRVIDSTKANYAHAAALLATSSALAAGLPEAEAAFTATAAAIERHFWSDAEGCARESWNADFTEAEPYRGANSNMHSLEAYLAAADVTGDPVWQDRALSIASHLINGHARAHAWRIPEHYNEKWQPLPDYNLEHPRHQFRPYGTTPGHSLEWARLLLSLEAAKGSKGSRGSAPAWLLPAAIALFDTAVADGWSPDGHPGFVYTVDGNGRPVVSVRLHWVECEAVLAADALHRRTGEARFAAAATRWWDEIDRYFVDRTNGGWWHELTPDMTPAASTVSGKPDLYHSYQAVLFPSLPLSPTAATALTNS